jgi:uncharacterized protein YjbI with pentapeptide repeats
MSKSRQSKSRSVKKPIFCYHFSPEQKADMQKADMQKADMQKADGQKADMSKNRQSISQYFALLP